jgi:hypothetical protein
MINPPSYEISIGNEQLISPGSAFKKVDVKTANNPNDSETSSTI